MTRTMTLPDPYIVRERETWGNQGTYDVVRVADGVIERNCGPDLLAAREYARQLNNVARLCGSPRFVHDPVYGPRR